MQHSFCPFTMTSARVRYLEPWNWQGVERRFTDRIRDFRCLYRARIRNQKLAYIAPA